MTHRVAHAFFVIVLLAAPVLAQNATACLAGCLSDFWSEVSRPFCDQNGETMHILSPQADTECPYECGVGVRYAGACGCPNNCQSSHGHGTCVAGACDCTPPWSGADCSLFTCAGGFACSGHGSCVTGGMIDDAAWADRCECAPGFTTYDCSQPALSLPSPLLGDLFPNESPYYVDDPYGDAHPVFNLSRVATLHVTMSDESLGYCLTAAYAYNQSFVQANVTYDNGEMTQAINNVGMRIKGASSRRGTIKNWRIAFDEYDSDARLVNLKSISLKTTHPMGDVILLRNIMAWASFRALHVPYVRMGLTQLWINQVYMGTYLIMEDLNGDFLKSRFGDNKGNLYKVHNMWLTPIGNASVFQTMNDGDAYDLDRAGSAAASIPPWQDLATAAQVIADANLAATGDISAVQAVVNTLGFGRSMIVEEHAYNKDGYTYYGNNWWMYNLDGVLQFLPYDYDDTFGDWLPPKGVNVSIYLWGNGTAFGRREPTYLESPLLTYLIFKTPSWRANFTRDYAALISAIEPTALNAHLNAIAGLVESSLPMNGLYELVWGNTSLYASMVEELTDYLTARYHAVVPMLEPLGPTTSLGTTGDVTSTTEGATTGAEQLSGSSSSTTGQSSPAPGPHYLTPILVTLAVVAVIAAGVAVYWRR